MFQEFAQGFTDNAGVLLKQVKVRLASVHRYVTDWNAKPKGGDAEDDNSCCGKCVIA